MNDLKNKEFELAVILGKRVLFTPDRIDRNAVPDGIYCYDLRSHDDIWQPLSIEDSVAGGRYGTVLSSEPFDLGRFGYAELGGRWELCGDYISLNEYMGGKA